MGEAVLGAFLPVLLEKLADGEVINYFGRLKPVNKKVLVKWTKLLTAIEAVLTDAEEKQDRKNREKQWLDDLRDLVYDVQDILAIYDTKTLEQRIEEQQEGTSFKSCISSGLSKLKFNCSVNSKIETITRGLEEITSRKEQLALKELGVSTRPWKMPQTTSQLEGPVFERVEDTARIVYKLLKEEHCTSSFQNFQVVAIVGTPGVGKTTLAKHVFNAPATEQFYPKGWVCVSDDFDLLRVTIAILESITFSHVTESKELNSVQQKLRMELAGKKFLIVLNDIWGTCNHRQWTALQSAFHGGATGSKIIVTTRDVKVAKTVGDGEPHILGSMSEDAYMVVGKSLSTMHGWTKDPKIWSY